MFSLLPLVFLISSSFAANDIFDLAEKYKEKNEKIQLREEQRRKVMGEVYQLEKETQKILFRKTDLDERKAKLDHDMIEASRDIIGHEEKIKALLPELLHSFNLSDSLEEIPWFYTLMSSDSAREIEELKETVDQMGAKISQRFAELTETLNSLKARRIELAQTAKNIISLKKEMSVEEKKLIQLEKSKKETLKKVENVLRSEKKRLSQLRKQGKSLTQESEDLSHLEALFDSGFYDKKGQLPVPVASGRLIHGYGLNKGLSLDRIQLLHKGHFYKTNGAEQARAVATGTVSYVGVLPGYGRVVVLDHGGHYYTTYANLKTSGLKKGQQVSAGMILGETGHPHLQMGTGLYFEIRYFSEPQNPSDWLKSPEGTLASLNN